jgi:hypothetical protein
MIKGSYYCGRLPDKLRMTERGIHIIWYHVKTTYEHMFVIRKAAGDDANRCKLDMHHNRISQVLFSEKTTTIHGSIHPAWFTHVMKIKSPSRHYDICPFCMRKVRMSKKIWTDEKRAIEVHHDDGLICTFPIKRKVSPLLSIMCYLMKTQLLI